MHNLPSTQLCKTPKINRVCLYVLKSFRLYDIIIQNLNVCRYVCTQCFPKRRRFIPTMSKKIIALVLCLACAFPLFSACKHEEGYVGPIINMLIGFFMGLSSGAGVVISQYYGAKRQEEVERTVHTAIVMTLVIGVLFTFLGIGMIPYMLRLMKTPDEILPLAALYLRIYFLA